MHFEYRNIVIVVSFIVIFVVSKRRYIVNNTTSIEFARSTTDGYRKFAIVDKSMSIESKLNTKNEIQNRIWKGFLLTERHSEQQLLPTLYWWYQHRMRVHYLLCTITIADNHSIINVVSFVWSVTRYL